MSDNEIVGEFLVESYENLDRLDRELVSLEKDPHNKDTLASIFRTIHTIKGTCGFLGFSKLEAVAHVGENLLSKIRDGLIRLNPEVTTALLAMVDAVRQMLASIENHGNEGERNDAELIATLTRLQQSGPGPTVPAIAAAAPPPADLTMGQLLIQNAGATPENVKAAVDKQERGDPRHLGEILVEEGAVKAVQVVEALHVQQSARTTQSSVADSTIRVDVGLLDKLGNLVGELVLARNQILQFTNSNEDSNLLAASQRLNLLTTEIQAGVMKTRMQPIGNIWNKLPRTVRDLAVACGKEVSVEMEGQDTELDKTIIEAIKDPLTHLVRNTVDHGIEKPEARRTAGKPAAGKLLLRAYHEGGQVIIEVADDGGGLDAEKIRRKAVERSLVAADQAARMAEGEVFQMIFLPGFSTAEKVTNVSGRGVGMDVVKTNVEKIGGSVGIQSKRGQGTTVRIKIPLTLAIVPALIVTCAGDRFAIPQVSLTELVRLEADEVDRGIELVHGAPVHRLRGQLLPLVNLGRELEMHNGAQPAANGDGAVNIVVLQSDGQPFGLIVDAVNDTEEIVVKPLRKQLKSIKTFAGASIMGDGRVALILDVTGLAQRSSVISEARHRRLAEKHESAGEKSAETKQTFLIFSGPDDGRMALPLDTLARLEELPAATVERSGQHWLAQYRGQILPLIHLGSVLAERRSELRHPRKAGGLADEQPLDVLVCNYEGQSVGIVVEAILDIVEGAADVRHPASRAGVLYSVVIDGRVTELIDIPAVLRKSGVFEPRPMDPVGAPV